MSTKKSQPSDRLPTLPTRNYRVVASARPPVRSAPPPVPESK